MSSLHSPFSEPMQAAVVWPMKFLPVEADDFVSNELIVKNVTTQQIWQALVDIGGWKSIAPVTTVETAKDTGFATMQKGNQFEYSTINLSATQCTITEVSPPSDRAGRLTWTATADRFRACHAWIVEGVGGGGVRLLSQQSQFGEEAVRRQQENVSLLEQQEFMWGIVELARQLS